MGSTFGGINTALTSLYAQRRGLDVTGQNIANANTEGYTRQRVRMAAQAGTVHPGIYSTTDAVGAGVERGRRGAPAATLYLEERGRAEHANSAYLDQPDQAAYNQIEERARRAQRHRAAGPPARHVGRLERRRRTTGRTRPPGPR